MSKQDSWLVVRKISAFVGGLLIIPVTLGFLVGDSSSVSGFAVAVGGPLFLFVCMLYFTKDDSRSLRHTAFWLMLWVLMVYFFSMFLTWYHSTDQAFLLKYTEKMRWVLEK